MPEQTDQNNLKQQEQPEAEPQPGIVWGAPKPEKIVTEADIALQKLVELGANHAALTAAIQELADRHNFPEISPLTQRIQDDKDVVLEFRVRLVGRNGVLASAAGTSDIPQLLLPSALQGAKQKLAKLLMDMILEPLSTKFADVIAPAQADYAAQNNALTVK